ncbi:cobalt-precorrin-6X reductase [Sphingomonas sp. Leaf34]|uniref:cobalt-precorrin-6A reductase n=1 Tax=Sphingomonas sp. Leaf34 TaxID=1736216 RepID=UPI0006FA4238|nr:cobalt-precorrin-6A reductase [Sphingomonas sp. Leaf34]KQN30521.1 cobalt-precorrin-6X reductase [Sphingomonas sp. Leaf34]
MSNVLVLGGTTEASGLAALLAARGTAAVLSYAGRVASPKVQPIPVRIGGFGGLEGLVGYLRDHAVTHLVDATHPFAARMSATAVVAAAHTGVAYIALTRPAWTPVAGDRWTMLADIDAAVAALAGPSRRVMLALGRMHVDAFSVQPQHDYLLRFVDTPDRPPGLPRHHLVVDRGPFDVEDERCLMEAHGTEIMVCKNAGGTGAQAKIVAARALGLPVIMIARPVPPPRLEVHAAEDVLHWLDHAADRGV